MTKVIITESYLEDIADAIRTKKVTQDTYCPSEMADAILSISGGGIIPTGTIEITANGTYNVTNYASADVSVSGGSSPIIESLTVTPTENQQVFDGSQIQVANIYSSTQGTKTISPSLNIGQTYYFDFEFTTDSHPLDPTIRTGTFTCTDQLQTVVASQLQISNTAAVFLNGSYDYYYLYIYTIAVDGYLPVTVNGISSTYVGSGITRRNSSDLSASGATVTVPAGYYSAQATKSVSSMTLPTSAAASATSGYTSKATISRSTSDQYINIPIGYNSAGAYYKISAVANGSATGPSSLSGSSASVSTGTNTLTLTKTGVTTTPTVSAGYVSSATASTATVTLTANVTTKAATTYNTSTTDQTISSGTYLTGTQTIKAVTVSGLSADKILSGTTVKIGDANDDDRIASVSGSVTLTTVYIGSGAPSSSLGSNNDIYIQS